MYGYIYLTTDLKNNKKYIGMKKSSIFLGKKYLGSGYIIKHLLEKYGPDRFEIEILDIAETDEELKYKEEYYIDFYNAVKSSEYYNLRRGGTRGPGGPKFKGHTHSEETKRKMSEDRKGSKNANYGNHWTASEELRKLHSELSKGSNNGMYGKHHSKESKLKNRLSNLNMKWINNGIENKRCKDYDVDKYINHGWKLGMLPKKKNIYKESATTIEN